MNHHREALRQANTREAALVHAILYVGVQIERVADRLTAISDQLADKERADGEPPADP